MKKIFSGSTLKLIAICAMILDHFGQVVLKNGIALKASYSMFTDAQFTYLLDVINVLHMLGRLAFPIFCFLLVEGFIHTHNLKKYLINLFIFAFIAEPIYDLSLQGTLFDINQQNVLFTLSLGLFVLLIIKRSNKNWLISSMIILVGAILSYICKMDGSYYGIGLISIFYLFYDKNYWKYIISIVYMYICGLDYSLYGIFNWYFLTAVSSVFLISLYNGTRGIKLKYLFYIFYPGHLFVFYLLSLIIEKMFLGC